MKLITIVHIEWKLFYFVLLVYQIVAIIFIWMVSVFADTLNIIECRRFEIDSAWGTQSKESFIPHSLSPTLKGTYRQLNFTTPAMGCPVRYLNFRWQWFIAHLNFSLGITGVYLTSLSCKVSYLFAIMVHYLRPLA